MAARPVEGQLLYGVEQAARILGIGSRMLWLYIASGEISIRKIGARTLIHRVELEKFARRDHAGRPKEEEEQQTP